MIECVGPSFKEKIINKALRLVKEESTVSFRIYRAMSSCGRSL